VKRIKFSHTLGHLTNFCTNFHDFFLISENSLKFANFFCWGNEFSIYDTMCVGPSASFTWHAALWCHCFQVSKLLHWFDICTMSNSKFRVEGGVTSANIIVTLLQHAWMPLPFVYPMHWIDPLISFSVCVFANRSVLKYVHNSLSIFTRMRLRHVVASTPIVCGTNRK